jgi:Tol biopolymer transport system component
MPSRRTLAAAVVAGSTLVAVSVTSAGASPPSTTLVSIAHGHSTGAAAGLQSPSVNGRYVAFVSLADDIVPGDTNRGEDLFVRDLKIGKTQRVSVSSTGAQANNSLMNIMNHAVTGTGRYVAFGSTARNLVKGDTNGTYDCFVRDLTKKTTVRASLGVGGVQGNDTAGSCLVTDDGNSAVFTSFANNLVPGDTNDMPDVFVRNLVTGAVHRITVTPTGQQAARGGILMDMTPDGRLIVIESISGDLVPGDTNDEVDQFVYDRRTGRMTQVDVASDGTRPALSGEEGSISADGSRVAFETRASLDPADTNQLYDIYVHDLASSHTALASLGRNGVVGDGNSQRATLSGDGSVVAFDSAADNLFPGDVNNAADIFSRDVGTPGLRLITQSPTGAVANGDSVRPVITRNGRAIAYSSGATNLGPEVDDPFGDVYLSR